MERKENEMVELTDYMYSPQHRLQASGRVCPNAHRFTVHVPQKLILVLVFDGFHGVSCVRRFLSGV